ncbi:MAG: hypothetical protein DRJ03_16995 [Chloroflexi bacterium]|nr:MAG: hypothetical protein DRJ03_16995 [Chloroflexota bacterium]
MLLSRALSIASEELNEARTQIDHAFRMWELGYISDMELQRALGDILWSIDSLPCRLSGLNPSEEDIYLIKNDILRLHAETIGALSEVIDILDGRLATIAANLENIGWL